MAYFAVSIFLSAFLLFQVEPMIARIILPWFGGTPAVWSTVMMFFQVLLTGGYAYASWLVRSRRGEAVHLILLGVSVGLMILLGLAWKSPITPDAGWKPGADTFPVWGIFKLLVVSVGLPFFLLSSNSPLVQAWSNRIFPERAAYRLYALSNAGSLIALVTYPVLVEPALTLAWQGRTWSLGFVVFAGLVAYGTVKSLRTKPAAGTEPATQVNDAMPSLSSGPRPSLRDYFLWISLAATASILLLATTSHITQEVAVIPFLWVLPLTIYLLSFVLAFSGERWYSRQFYLVLFFIATLLYAWALVNSGQVAILLQVGIFSLMLFTACMVCHGELYRLRPHPAHLTTFYLMVSIGGALGGILVNFVAPYVFKGFWELPLGVVLCWLLFLIVTVVAPSPRRSRLIFFVNAVLLVSALAISSVQSIQSIQSDTRNYIGSWRNFYGVVRVQELGADGWLTHAYSLVHGITIHGEQYVDDAMRSIPTTYYGPTGGAGLAILNYPRQSGGLRVGVLGLGVGTLSTYGRPGDVYRFYEINPVVIRLAEGEGGYFSFLQDSAAEIEIVPGDARLSLERELADGHPQNYDILVLDVFSSDSIPVHLLDKEAFDLYLQHLKPDGILAVHITNRHLDLKPVVWTLADHYHLGYVLIDDPGDYSTTSHSIWMLLSPDPSRLEVPAIQGRAAPMDGYVSRVRLWTDDYSNLFQILK
jgi:hypothetical protein